MKTTVYFVRHGEYESPDRVLPYRLPGFHLSEKGKMQVESLVRSLRGEAIIAVYTSPLERTYETAVILAKSHGLLPIVDERLLEVRSPAQGEKEGFVESKGGWAIYESAWFKEHDGESMVEVSVRMQEAMDNFVKKHLNCKIIVVSHGDPIMLLVAHYKGIPLTPDDLLASHPYVLMAGGYRIEFEEGNEAKVYPIVAT